MDGSELHDLAPCGLFTTTADDVISRVNDTFVEWTGFSRDELIGRRFVSLLEPGSQLFYESRYLTALRLRGNVNEVALQVRRADGTAFPALINSSSSIDAGGVLTVHGAVFDATERQDYERQLLDARRSAEESERRLRALLDASVAFEDCQSEAELADALALTAVAAFGAHSVCVRVGSGDANARDMSGEPVLEVPSTLSEDQRGELTRGGVLFLSDGSFGETLRAAGFEAASVVALVEGTRELGFLTAYFRRATGDIDEELQRALARQASQTLVRIRLQSQLEAIALYDPLTGLANRNLLRTHIADTLEKSHRNGDSMSLLFVDLDDFKSINDELDHSAGDEVLRQVADRLRSAVRRQDLVGRYGGDEFIVVCENTDDPAAVIVAERIRTLLREPLQVTGLSRTVTASIGVAVHAPGVETPPTAATVFRAADAAMYRSKGAGKDQITTVSL